MSFNTVLMASSLSSVSAPNDQLSLDSGPILARAGSSLKATDLADAQVQLRYQVKGKNANAFLQELGEKIPSGSTGTLTLTVVSDAKNGGDAVFDQKQIRM